MHPISAPAAPGGPPAPGPSAGGGRGPQAVTLDEMEDRRRQSLRAAAAVVVDQVLAALNES